MTINTINTVSHFLSKGKLHCAGGAAGAEQEAEAVGDCHD